MQIQPLCHIICVHRRESGPALLPRFRSISLPRRARFCMHRRYSRTCPSLPSPQPWLSRTHARTYSIQSLLFSLAIPAHGPGRAGRSATNLLSPSDDTLTVDAPSSSLLSCWSITFITFLLTALPGVPLAVSVGRLGNEGLCSRSLPLAADRGDELGRPPVARRGGGGKPVSMTLAGRF